MQVVNFFADQVRFFFNLVGFENPLMFSLAFAILVVVEIVAAVSILVKVFDLARWIGTFFMFRLIFGEWRQTDSQLRKQQARHTVNPDIRGWAMSCQYAIDRIGQVRDEIAKDEHTYNEKEYNSISLAKLSLHLKFRRSQYRLAWKTAKRLGFPYFQNMQDYITMSTEAINAHLGVSVKS